MSQRHIIFGNIGGPMGQGGELPSYLVNYNFNTLLFEIYANWDGIKELMKKLINKSKKNVNQIEQEWVNFLMSNGINILEYDNSEDFLNKHFKSPL